MRKELKSLLIKLERIKETKKLNIPYRSIALVVFSFFLVLALYNLFVYVRVREQYRALQKQWNAMAERSAQADQLEQELGAGILAEVDFYDALVSPELETARIMNQVSELLPAGVWLTQMKFVRKRKNIQLTLDGVSESARKSSKLIDIQNFVNQLKAQMEQFVGPESAAKPSVKKLLKAAITTSSQKDEKAQSDVTQFTAIIETEGFASAK